MKDKDDVDGEENCRFVIMITMMMVLNETVLCWLVGWWVSGCNKMQSTSTSQIS